MESRGDSLSLAELDTNSRPASGTCCDLRLSLETENEGITAAPAPATLVDRQVGGFDAEVPLLETDRGSVTAATTGRSRLSSRVIEVLIMLVIFVVAKALLQAGATSAVALPSSTSGASAQETPGLGPTATSGFRVSGNHFLDPHGTVFVPRGVVRPSLEWSCRGQAVNGASGIPRSDFATMGSQWHANTVRLPLNEVSWLSDSGTAVAPGHECPGYRKYVSAVVAAARASGLVVILDLHWSDAGNARATQVNQQCMADQDSLSFWGQVATRFRTDSGVWFELYNEPHSIPWKVWRDGGTVDCLGHRFVAVGMQQMVDRIRQSGAANIVLAGGNEWAYDLSGIGAWGLRGFNIAYATHPYAAVAGLDPEAWEAAFGWLASTVPVVATEISGSSCAPDGQIASLMAFLRRHADGYTAWAWWAGGCSFPSLLQDASGACVPGASCTIRADLEMPPSVGPIYVPTKPNPSEPTRDRLSSTEAGSGWQPAWGGKPTLGLRATNGSGPPALTVSAPGGTTAISTRAGLAEIRAGTLISFAIWVPSQETGERSADVVTATPWILGPSWTVMRGARDPLQPGWNTVRIVATTGLAAGTVYGLGLQFECVGPEQGIEVDGVTW